MSLSAQKEEVLRRGVALLTVEYDVSEFVSTFAKEYAVLSAELTDDLKHEPPGKYDLAVLESPDFKDFLRRAPEDVSQVIRIYLWQYILEKTFLGEGNEILWSVYDDPTVEVIKDKVIIKANAYKFNDD